MQKTLYLSFILILFFQSCNTVKKGTQAQNEIQRQSLKNFKTNYLKNQDDFNHLQIKGKIDADIKGKSKSAALRMYVAPQDKIWLNVSLLGITGARALFTPTQVQAYEVLDRTYVDSDFTYLNNELGVDFIDFNKLTNLLTGRLFLIDDWSAYVLKNIDDNYILSYSENESLLKNPQKGKYPHTFYIDADYRLQKAEITDSANDVSIEVYYNKWNVFDGKSLPQIVKVLINKKEQDKIELEYNNFDFSKMNPPFRIPSGYSERKIK